MAVANGCWKTFSHGRQEERFRKNTLQISKHSALPVRSRDYKDGCNALVCVTEASCNELGYKNERQEGWRGAFHKGV